MWLKNIDSARYKRVFNIFALFLVKIVMFLKALFCLEYRILTLISIFPKKAKLQNSLIACGMWLKNIDSARYKPSSLISFWLASAKPTSKRLLM